ncbi:metallophosphoesterase [Mycobacteroides abscessus]|uniref:metallophosphoesterase n=1 Tax=Mycobacteroides abscessus TaxID=36809 RepID=UPI00232B8BC7|nr:metallophosphoesterase [Mycobacteroides abscessus]MDB2213922.1 metallophosphoesterase [Mycobacteroides abscessus subsp. massiliense]WJJ55521.1 MRE11 double-strand break endo/exonuclease [Mycobacterium phage prophiT49-2]
MSNVWFTSDLHIGHEKVARERTRGWVLPRYVGAEIDSHNAQLARNWDSMVAPDDVVWVLGDISSGTKTAQLRALDWLRARPGRKRGIPGNHCGTHPLHRDSHKWLPIYLGQDQPDRPAPFECVQLAAKVRIPLRDGHVTAMLSHFPYTGDHTDEDRYPEWRLPDYGHYILHGHTHSPEKLSIGGREAKRRGAALRNKPARINQIHVGVDAWDDKPVALDQIIEIIQGLEDRP